MEHTSQSPVIHSFSRKLASQYGITAAILIGYLANRIHSVQVSRKDQRGFFITVSKLAQRYPYLSRSTIADALLQLREAGVLEADNSKNTRKTDRTLWYTFKNKDVEKDAAWDPIYFNVKDAQELDVTRALILKNVAYWVREKQKTDPEYTWHRISAVTLAEHLPVGVRSLRRALERLASGPLERRKCGGWDGAFEYRFRGQFSCAQPVQDTQGTAADSEVTTADTQRTEAEIPGTIADCQGSKPDDVTILIGAVEKLPVEKPLLEGSVFKNTFINPQAAPPGSCVCLLSHSPETESKGSHSESLPSCIPGGASDAGIQGTRLNEKGEVVTAAGTVATPAEIHDMVRKFLKRPSSIAHLSPVCSAQPASSVSSSSPVVSVSASSVAAAPVEIESSASSSTSHSLPVAAVSSSPSAKSSNKPAYEVQLFKPFDWTLEERAKDESIFLRSQIQLADEAKRKQEEKERLERRKQRHRAKFERLLEKFESPFHAQEKEKTLSPEVKVRVLKAAIISRLKTGTIDERTVTLCPVKLFYDKKGLEKARRIFELNPDSRVSSLLALLDECTFTVLEADKHDEGFDKAFYERRANNLSFFLNHLRYLSTKHSNYSLPPEFVYLDDDEEAQTTGSETESMKSEVEEAALVTN